MLLTPGVFLRVGENSAIRMVANSLMDTRVELLAGSAVLDSVEPGVKAPVTLIYRGWNVRQREKGGYRIDGEPPRVVVREGEVEVAAGGGVPVRVGSGLELPLAAVLVPMKPAGELQDRLGEWARGRAEAVAADDAIAAGIEDPASVHGSMVTADDFTYFPMLGLSSIDPSLMSGSPSGFYAPQLGFSSIYLPGYTYRPLLIGVPVLRLSVGRLPGYILPSLPPSPSRMGGAPRLPTMGAPAGLPMGGMPMGYPTGLPTGTAVGHPAGGAPIGRPPGAHPVPGAHQGAPVTHPGAHVGVRH